MLDLDLDRLAVLQRAQPFVVGAAGDQVAASSRSSPSRRTRSAPARGAPCRRCCSCGGAGRRSRTARRRRWARGSRRRWRCTGRSGQRCRTTCRASCRPSRCAGPRRAPTRRSGRYSRRPRCANPPALTFLAGPLMTSASSASCMKIHGSVNSGSTIVSPGPDHRVGVLQEHVEAAAPRAAHAPSNWRCSRRSCRAAAGAGAAAPSRAAPPRPRPPAFPMCGRSRSNPSIRFLHRQLRGMATLDDAARRRRRRDRSAIRASARCARPPRTSPISCSPPQTRREDYRVRCMATMAFLQVDTR